MPRTPDADRRAFGLRRRPARSCVTKIRTVVSHSPAPRFGVGKGKTSLWSIGRRRRLTGIGAAARVSIARFGGLSVVEHRWNAQQGWGADDHQHERNDAYLLRKNVQFSAPKQDQQHSGSREDREQDSKAETRSPLLAADLA